MPLGDVTYQDAALDAVVASWPASGAVYRLYNDDPTLGGVELDSDGGYAPVAFDPADWDAAADGVKQATVSFGTSTDSWSDSATWWAVVDGSDLFVYYAALADEAVIAVDEAGTEVTLNPAIAFGDGS